MLIWNFIYSHLSNNEKVELIVVIDTQGSSPGHVGFKMAVAENGEIAGSIGGGIMEHDMVEKARKLLKTKCEDTTVIRQIHNPESEHDKSGMICSGEQTQAFITLTSSHLEVVTMIIQCISAGEKCTLTITNNYFRVAEGPVTKGPVSVIFKNLSDWEYNESLGLSDTVYIFGGGHISLPLCQILRMLDFRVVVYDDRLELSTFEANTFAHFKKVIDYKDVSHLVPDNPDSYVVIMSFGHKSDDVILRQMLPKKLKYLGMIGSKSKIGVLFEKLKNEGFTDESLSRVNAPIGILIGSQTPAEIAVSIVAKIIEVRNR